MCQWLMTLSMKESELGTRLSVVMESGLMTLVLTESELMTLALTESELMTLVLTVGADDAGVDGASDAATVVGDGRTV